jgi:hypothetical protein
MNDGAGDISRRELCNTLLGVVGGGFAASFIAGCASEPGPQPLPGETVEKTTQALATGARIDYASQLLIVPGASAQSSNTTKIVQWQNDSQKAFHTLVFDEPGTYFFDPNILRVKLGRKFATNAGSIVTAPGTANDYVLTVETGGTVENLTVDAGGTCGYAILLYQSIVQLTAVTARNAIAAGIYCLHMPAIIDNCATSNCKVGLLMVGAYDSLVRNFSFSAGAIPTEAAIRVRGNAVDTSVPNTGRVRMFGVRLAPVDTVPVGADAIDFDGVTQSDIHGITIEGASYGVRMRNKSNSIRIFGFRCTTGFPVIFDQARACEIYGVSHSSAIVDHLSNDQRCRAFLVVENVDVPSDIPHRWGGVGGFQAWCRQDGWLAEGIPTLATYGYWTKGDVIWRKTPALNQPIGWRCYESGSPGIWSAMPNYT